MPRRTRRLFKRLGKFVGRSFTSFLIWTCTAKNFDAVDDEDDDDYDYDDFPDTFNMPEPDADVIDESNINNFLYICHGRNCCLSRQRDIYYS